MPIEKGNNLLKNKTMINLLWPILGIISIILLIVFWRTRNAVWGGLMLGVIVGFVISIFYLFKESGFNWFIIAKGAIAGTLVGFIAELLGKVSDFIKKSETKHRVDSDIERDDLDKEFEEKNTVLNDSSAENDELKKFKVKLEILNHNSEITLRLLKRAKNEKNYVAAFFYFFYNFELFLKHLIMTEMMVKNSLKFVEEKRDLFPIYKADQINAIQEIGKVSDLIGKFNSIFGNQVGKELNSINNERIFLIHKMMKERVSEKEVENFFANFFEKNKHDIYSTYKYFDTLLEIRPQKILSVLKREINKKDRKR